MAAETYFTGGRVLAGTLPLGINRRAMFLLQRRTGARARGPTKSPRELDAASVPA